MSSTAARIRRTRKHRRLQAQRQRSRKRVSRHRAKTGRTGSVHEKRQPSRASFAYVSCVPSSMPSAALHASRGTW